MDIGNVLFVEWADCLAGSAVGGVLEHLGKADAALDVITFDAFVVPRIITSPKGFILVRDRTRWAGSCAFFTLLAEPEHTAIYGLGLRQWKICYNHEVRAKHGPEEGGEHLPHAAIFT